MAYGKLKDNGEIEIGTLFQLLRGVSNPIALSLPELNERGVYKVVNDNTKLKKWQRIKNVSYVFENGEIIKKLTVENIGLKEFKKIKKSQIKSTLSEIINEGFTSSKGYKVDIKAEDRSNWINNLQVLELSGATETIIRDYNNVQHTLSKTEYQNLIKEVGAYVSKQFNDKWKLQDMIESATTYKGVDEIFWRKPNYDSNGEFVDWTYNTVLGGE